jgi:hypothetical protein
MLKLNEICKAKDDSGSYRECKIVALNKKSARIEIDGIRLTLPYQSLWKMKNKTKRSRFDKICDNNLVTKRLGRHRKIQVVPTHFTINYRGPDFWGDFSQMIQDPACRHDGLFLFNDNHDQWNFAYENPTIQQAAGGGNAAVRPWEYDGHAIGIPTGPYQNLQSIRTLYSGGVTQQLPAKDIIDLAFKRIVKHCIEHPDKSTLYYSAAPHSENLGLGIFANSVGDDVVQYITQKLKKLPDDFLYARVNGVV